MDGFIVPRSDEHLGEYVPASAERLAWLTGFTGSAGLAVVLADHRRGLYGWALRPAARQANRSRALATAAYYRKPPPAWLAEHAPKGGRIGYDPMLISAESLARYSDAGLNMVPVESNPIDVAWTDRPAPPARPPSPMSWFTRAGRQRINVPTWRSFCGTAKQDAAVLTDPASIAWLLNIRGGDVPFTPFALSFALVHADGALTCSSIPPRCRPKPAIWLGNAVSITDRP